MAKSTAPILIIGGVTLLNRTLQLMELNKFPASTAVYTTNEGVKIVAATGLTAGIFALLEKVNQPLTVGIAWVALVSVLLVGIPDGRGNSTSAIQTIQRLRDNPEVFLAK